MLDPNLKVCYSIECLPEHESVRGNASCSGDDEFDRECEDTILADLEWNPWAWCTVKVSCWVEGYEDIKGDDYLGCCNYKNEADFKASGYYEDMMNEAGHNLMDKLSHLKSILHR